MFPNLKAEMARNKLSGKRLCELVNMNYESYRNKMSGATEFKLGEMLAIQSVFRGCTLEYLFEKEEEGGDR